MSVVKLRGGPSDGQLQVPADGYTLLNLIECLPRHDLCLVHQYNALTGEYIGITDHSIKAVLDDLRRPIDDLRPAGTP